MTNGASNDSRGTDKTTGRVVRVDLGARSYEVTIGIGALSGVGLVVRERLGGACRKAFLVVDDGVPPTNAETVEKSMRAQGIVVLRGSVHPTESNKSLASFERLVAELTTHRLERKDVVIALGGGVVGDLAGFAAACYRRGIPVVQCPTTLLSMVDASVGGKTGVNVELSPGDLKKNMVGAFHQPEAVMADISVLGSLDERHFRAGLAECVKHGMIAADFGDATLLEWTSASAGRILARDSSALVELIGRNIAIKAAVVAGDEREESAGAGGRALLNLGHTFGHAIEALPGARATLADHTELPGNIHHGEAVALGLRAACVCAANLNLIPAASGRSVGTLLDSLGLPSAARGLPGTDAIVERMSHDKKNLAGVSRLVLPIGEGRAAVVENPRIDAVQAAIESIRA
ncbi:MAG: 3-dehydroquinate synthase [Phycisphaeraceae bacterium]|nr:3-dehydroquinate synthase [Phycisphaeraceae bacterium]